MGSTREAIRTQAIVRRNRDLSFGTLEVDAGGRFLLRHPHQHGSSPEHSLGQVDNHTGHLVALAGRFAELRRRAKPEDLDYLLLVPTLRCNLNCDYCQVSRAAIDAKGYDWSQDTLNAVLALLARLTAKSVKIEFQGGEPTLRPDLIKAVIQAVPEHVEAQFVICTNLETLDREVLEIFDRPDVAISTSLDGPAQLHAAQRRSNGSAKTKLFENLEFAIDRYGPGKISALPTINPLNPPAPDELIEAFLQFGLEEIYLRPINFQGFARKKHPASKDIQGKWLAYHEQFLRRLIERNFEDRSRVLSESYFTLLLNRVFRPGLDRHVDLRNPNPVGVDYVVIDHDGCVFPTDEARMLARAGVIDLSIGDVFSGWSTPEREALDRASTNDGDPVCEACAYKPYCGRDIVDDISRYGTINLPRDVTSFCQRHLHLFDLAFEMIYSTDENVRYSLARWLDLPGEFPSMDVVS